MTTTHVLVPSYVREICAELDFPLVLPARIQAYMEEHGIQDRRASILTQSESDPHPTALAHRLQAEGIFEHLMASGKLGRALEDRGAE